MATSAVPVPPFWLGTTVTIDIAVTDIDGIAVDPATITARVVQPDGTDIDPAPTVVNDTGTGAYHLDIPTDQTGTYRAKVTTTDPDTAPETSFYVRTDLP